MGNPAPDAARMLVTGALDLDAAFPSRLFGIRTNPAHINMFHAVGFRPVGSS